jgi:hypothetical protein
MKILSSQKILLRPETRSNFIACSPHVSEFNTIMEAIKKTGIMQDDVPDKNLEQKK